MNFSQIKMLIVLCLLPSVFSNRFSLLTLHLYAKRCVIVKSESAQERADKMAHSDSVARQKKWNNSITMNSDGILESSMWMLEQDGSSS